MDRGCRIQKTRAFARHFNNFEWKDLWSYRWFLTLMDHRLDTGDFSAAQARSAQTLVNGKLRKQPEQISFGVPNNEVQENHGW